MANIEEIISTLERAAEDAVKRYKDTSQSQDPWAQQRMAQASVLAAYATYKTQERTLIALKEQTSANIQVQTAAITEFRQQAKWTKRLVIVTSLLALATLVLAIATIFSR